MLNKDQLKDCVHKKELSRIDILLLILCVNSNIPKKVSFIKELGRNAGIPEILRWNISDTFRNNRTFVINVPEGWLLTTEGKKHISSLAVIPQKKTLKIINLATNLQKEIEKINDKNTKSFIEEAITCFEAGLYRSCVVLSWCGAISLLYDAVITHHLTMFNTEAQRRDAKWKNANNNDDLARMKESTFLDIIAAPPLSIIGKNVKQELNNCLDLRNGCGHPNSLIIGENKVAAHLEILILNIFKKFH